MCYLVPVAYVKIYLYPKLLKKSYTSDMSGESDTTHAVKNPRTPSYKLMENESEETYTELFNKQNARGVFFLAGEAAIFAYNRDMGSGLP